HDKTWRSLPLFNFEAHNCTAAPNQCRFQHLSPRRRSTLRPNNEAALHEALVAAQHPPTIADMKRGGSSY
ncbi:hypothetical protein Dimus_018279, partial [Dionaea muscipula]